MRPLLPPGEVRQGHFHVRPPRHRVLQGDCIEVLPGIPTASADLVLTDPPYLVRYRDRIGRTVANDDRAGWLRPAFREIARVMKPGSVCISFYGWQAVAEFMLAWRDAGLRPVGHLVFAKHYASSTRYFRHHHEQAYVLAKGNAPCPAMPLSDVRPWRYTSNLLHPTQKSVEILRPLIETFCPRDGLVLDPFCGSGSTLVAARSLGRRAIGIELDPCHCRTAEARLKSLQKETPRVEPRGAHVERRSA
ncbi:DNA methyltransferase [Rhodoplanes serenus]|uniref:DNA methyltransferase n=1 Tax=Rhodoplanes serenus TaxID=200615 RepID=UPI000DAD1E52|nr:DNA methyltransferase [Rhodoplanes serenus]RAI35892.1 DNA methylase [Rhodoplanes serenus]